MIAQAIVENIPLLSIDEIFDAYTRGSYIEKDRHIEVISEEGTSLKVKEIENPNTD